jgi:hypothetical protein
LAVERCSYAAEVEQCYISFATLDLPHMRAIKTGLVGQGLLRQAEDVSPRADGLS